MSLEEIYKHEREQELEYLKKEQKKEKSELQLERKHLKKEKKFVTVIKGLHNFPYL